MANASATRIATAAGRRTGRRSRRVDGHRPHGASSRAQAVFGGLGRDVTLGVRSLIRRPGFAAVNVLTLALGIGANAAIFSAVYGIVLRPLPYQRPDRLVVVWENLKREHNPRFSVSLPNFSDFKARTAALSGLAAQFGNGVSMKVDGIPELARAARVTGDYFDVLGVHALVGRTFTPSDTLRPTARSSC